MSHQDRFRRIKVQFMKSYPFYGALLDKVKIFETERIQSAGINVDNEIGVNPTYWENASENLQLSTMGHEILHGVLLHPQRIFKYISKEDQKLGNIAADFLVNYILKESGLQIFDGWLYNKKYNPNDYTLESLVNELRKDPKMKQMAQAMCMQDMLSEMFGQGQVGKGDDTSKHGKGMTQAEQRQKEVEMKMAMASAVMIAKKAGNCPGSIERMVEEQLKPRVNWKEELYEWFTKKVRDVTTWNRPNRRFVYRGMYLPTKFSEGCGHIGVSIDVSGSISNKELAIFESEINYIFEKCKPEKVTILYFDHVVQKVEEFEELPIVLRSVGGGGTNFKCAFDHFNKLEEKLEGMIFMTDMCGEWPKEPVYPTVILSTTKNQDAPFGKTIYCDIRENLE